MSGFIPWLESLSNEDTRVRAVLRRSLAFEPGIFIPAFPYVEPFLKGDGGTWRRTAHYLTAGLWAAHGNRAASGDRISVGRACALHQLRSGSASTEKRLLALLDADPEQLPNRLSQVRALLDGQPLDFAALLQGTLAWNDEQRRTQVAWARDFYRALDPA
jgi:CRISPR system Cascade subunit CasB